MNRGAKDSPEAVKFRSLFAQLNDWCDDTPNELADFATRDSGIADLCTQIDKAAQSLEE